MEKAFIEKNWPLTRVKVGEALGENNNLGIIESAEGKYVYKIARDWKTHEAVERDLSVFDFLNSIGFPHISRYLKTISGKGVVVVGNDLIYLIEYIEGTHPKASPETYAELGRITGLLHGIKDFPFETDFDADVIIEDLKETSKQFEFGKEYLKVVESLPSFHDLPKSLIHGDISPLNTIKKADETFILLDWDEAGIGTRILDIGHPLINQFISEDLEFFEDNARAFYKAYLKEQELSDEEMNRVFDSGMFWACMYIIYGDTAKRWKRIQWAIENKSVLEKLIRSCSS